MTSTYETPIDDATWRIVATIAQTLGVRHMIRRCDVETDPYQGYSVAIDSGLRANARIWPERFGSHIIRFYAALAYLALRQMIAGHYRGYERADIVARIAAQLVHDGKYDRRAEWPDDLRGEWAGLVQDGIEAAHACLR